MRALVFLLLFQFSHLVSAASVIEENFGGQMTIASPDKDMRVGDIYYAVDAKGKKTSKIEIISIQNGKAEGRQLKGNAVAGQALVKATGATASAAGAKRLDADAGEFPTEEPKAKRPARREDQAVAEEPSQSSSFTHWAFGLGLAYFKIGGLDSSLKYDTGLSVAGLYSYGWGRSFLETGLRYYQAGTKVDKSGVTATLTYNYLGLPLLFKYSVSDGDYSFRVKGGLMYGYLMSGKVKAEVGTETVDESMDLDGVDRGDNLFQLGVELVSRGSGDHGFWSELIYTRSFKKMASATSALSGGTAEPEKKAFHEGLLLNLGLSFE